VTTVASGLKGPFGIAFRGDTMYVAQRASSSASIQAPAIRPLMALPVAVTRTRTIVFDPTGKLYVAVGSSCNLCDERDSMRAAVTPAQSERIGRPRLREGVGNTVGIRVIPKTNELWGGITTATTGR